MDNRYEMLKNASYTEILWKYNNKFKLNPNDRPLLPYIILVVG